jgi:hypothetical protein
MAVPGTLTITVSAIAAGPGLASARPASAKTALNTNGVIIRMAKAPFLLSDFIPHGFPKLSNILYDIPMN